jgi:hypothetical protein
MPDEFPSTAEVARRLHRSPRTIRAMIRSGIFREGEHFRRLAGCQPFWDWQAVVRTIENEIRDAESRATEIRLARGGGRALL